MGISESEDCRLLHVSKLRARMSGPGCGVVDRWFAVAVPLVGKGRDIDMTSAKCLLFYAASIISVTDKLILSHSSA